MGDRNSALSTLTGSRTKVHLVSRLQSPSASLRRQRHGKWNWVTAQASSTPAFSSLALSVSHNAISLKVSQVKKESHFPLWHKNCNFLKLGGPNLDLSLFKSNCMDNWATRTVVSF